MRNIMDKLKAVLYYLVLYCMFIPVAFVLYLVGLLILTIKGCVRDEWRGLWRAIYNL